MKKFRISAIAAIIVLALASTAATAAPVITAVYTTYSAAGVPTDLNITGTGLCSNITCSTKPIVKLAGVQQAVSGATTTGVGVKLGIIGDGDYVLSLAVAATIVNYNLTIRSGIKSGTGTSATVSVGTTTTGLAGTNALVTNSGTSSAAVLNFTIPRGATGPTGATGPNGPPGPQGPVGLPGPQGVQGIPGVVGAVGATGETGPAGPKGDKGDAGSTGAGLTYKGNWTDTDSYLPLDVVTHDGSSYIALRESLSVNPMSDVTAAGGYWAMLAARGSDGVAGKDGTVGPEGPPGVSGPPGFDGPQGPEGPQGVSGPIGPEGPRGEQGPPGTNGLAYRGLYQPSADYSEGELVHTSLDLVGLPYYCQYFSRTQSSGVNPREHSDPSDPAAAWFTLDPACRSDYELPKYSVTDLSIILGDASIIALNNKNQILGSENGRLFTYSPNSQIKYIDLENNEFRELGIKSFNDNGEMVGSASRIDGTRTAILIRNNAIEDIGINIGTNESDGVSINNSGQIIINYKSNNIDYPVELYVYESNGGSFSPINIPEYLYPSAYHFEARAINDNGVVAISTTPYGGAVNRTYLWKNGADLVDRGQIRTYKINNSNTVIGETYYDGFWHEGFSSGNPATIMDNPAKINTYSKTLWTQDMNNHGDIVGYFIINPPDNTAGYIYFGSRKYGEKIINLNYLLDSSSEKPYIGIANLINDNGWIIAGSFLLIPKNKHN